MDCGHKIYGAKCCSQVRILYGCLFSDNYDYDDDNINSKKACGFNIVLIALTMAMNDDSIVLCSRSIHFFQNR